MSRNTKYNEFKNIVLDNILSCCGIFAIVVFGLIIYSIFPVPFHQIFMTQETKSLRQEMHKLGGSLNGINSGRIIVHSENVTDLSLEFFRDKKTFLGRCWYVDLSGTKVTDNVMILLEEIENLQYLNLSNTKISDSAIAKMRSHCKLRTLILNDTDITDQCANSLICIPMLELLEINNTKISSQIKYYIHCNCPSLNVSNGFSCVDQTPENRNHNEENKQKPDNRSCLRK